MYPDLGSARRGLETVNHYGGTALSGALWGALNTPENGDYVAVIDSLLPAGARIDPGMTEWWKNEASTAVATHAYLNCLKAQPVVIAGGRRATLPSIFVGHGVSAQVTMTATQILVDETSRRRQPS